MKCFVIRRQPVPYQKRVRDKNRNERYKLDLVAGYNQFNAGSGILTGDLYGLVYYFQRSRLNSPDADNISKLVWDALRSVSFVDDDQIRYRIAGIVDLSPGKISTLDLTGLPPKVGIEIADAAYNANDFIYVECGKLNQALFRVKLE